MTNESKDSPAIELTVRISARCETVFRFFSDPERYQSWMGQQSTIEPKLGGILTVSFGPGPTASGRIVEMVENERIVFSWGHEEGAGRVPPESTRVTITLTPTEEGTLVRLRHDGLPTEEQRTGHKRGWAYYLSSLAHLSACDRMVGQLDSILEAYIGAWNETDPTVRGSLLEQCWAREGVFRDRYGFVEGRDALSDYIGGVQMMMSGAKLQVAGVSAQTHFYVRHPWKSVNADGDVLARGTNFLQLDLDGRIASVVGFWDQGPAVG